MHFKETRIPGVLIVETRKFGDERGFLRETFRENLFVEAGISGSFVQENFTHSVKDALRGLHFQEPHPQGKLVQVVYGAIWDVAVDIRPDSPTFRQWEGIELDAKEGRLLWVPPGFAHGFCVLSNSAGVLYKCTDYYEPANEKAVAWNDPDIQIPWPVANPRLSERDGKAARLAELRKRPSTDAS